ncbi:TetR family transcriptional regulator [Streptomyces sp. NPDC090442]|uniref:TetR family transcriptional regulator n=1 Tax=Streptomyces sp. NPDC090442 TaxID=3365962 RepID=UPI0037F8D148
MAALRNPADAADAPTEDRRQHRDRRQRKERQARESLATAALELILEHGLAGTTVEAIADRAEVTRRTFSRYFVGKEDAALDFVRGDGDRINALLRARPADEPPLLAYRRAIGAWLADGESPGWHLQPRTRRLLALVDREPALFAAYARIRVDAHQESVRILAERLGTDARDVRPVVVVETAAGVLSAALSAWAHAADTAAGDLPRLVERAYDALASEAAAAHMANSP